jgi:hypothetical protein
MIAGAGPPFENSATVKMAGTGPLESDVIGDGRIDLSGRHLFLHRLRIAVLYWTPAFQGIARCRANFPWPI